MIDRRTLLFGAALVPTSFGLSGPASAVEGQAFSESAFQQAQAAGTSILVHVTAPWCPTCKAQKPILGRLEAEPKFKALKVFDVDFDTQKDAVRRFNARMQSTLIAFKGAQEGARSVGDTRPGSIEALLDKSN